MAGRGNGQAPPSSVCARRLVQQGRDALLVGRLPPKAAEATGLRRPSAPCVDPLPYRGVSCAPRVLRVCAACAAHDRLVLTHDFSCAFRVSLFAWGVRTCALACAFWLWAFFGGPFHIRGIARIGEGLGYPRSSSDAKQAPLEPRKAPRISEKPLPGVRGGTEGNRGDPRMRQFSPARAQNPVRTEEPREAPRTSEESPTGGPTGNRGEAEVYCVLMLPQEL